MKSSGESTTTTPESTTTNRESAASSNQTCFKTHNNSPKDIPNNNKKRRPRILLGITGSVAAVKGPEIAVRLSREVGADVQILLTRGGENFFWNKAKEYDPICWERFTDLWQGSTANIATGTTDDEKEKEVLGEKDECANFGENTDCKQERNEGYGSSNENASCGIDNKIILHAADDEWKDWNKLGDPILHINLRNWADMILIAPLSAHTLAKLATGLCDDTLSCCVRAWDFGHGLRPGKPLILCPAMNTAMWVHPLTRSQLDTVCGFSNSTRMGRGGKLQVHVVEPQEKTLACGEVGTGALADVSEIIRVTKTCLEDYGAT